MPVLAPGASVVRVLALSVPPGMPPRQSGRFLQGQAWKKPWAWDRAMKIPANRGLPEFL